MAQLYDIIDEWMNEQRELFLDNYDRFGLRASGNTEKQTKVETRELGLITNSKLVGPSYVEQMDKGRRPNQAPTRKAVNALYPLILEWQQQKASLPPELKTKGAAWGIAYKIVNFGINVPNTYNKGGVLTKAFSDSRYEALYDKLRSFYVENIQATLFENLDFEK